VAIDMSHAPDTTTHDHTSSGAGPARTRVRRRALLAGAIVVVLAAASLVSARVAADRAHQGALGDFEQAVAALTEARGDLAAVAGDAGALAGLGEEVRDPATVSDLVAALDDVDALDEVPGEGPDVPWRSWSTAELRAGAVDLDAALARTRTVHEDLAAEVAAVEVSHQGWLVEQAVAALDAARAELDAAMSHGEDVLAASEGKVTDNQVREHLRAALDDAISARQAAGEVPAEVALLSAAAEALRSHLDPLDAARHGVTDAQAAWESEQARLAAEQAAAAAAAAQRATAAPRPGTGSTSTSAGSSASRPRAGTTGNPPATSTPAAPQQDDRSAAEILGGSNRICGDAFGNSWDC
jgi:hypothetical protein